MLSDVAICDPYMQQFCQYKDNNIAPSPNTEHNTGYTFFTTQTSFTDFNLIENSMNCFKLVETKAEEHFRFHFWSFFKLRLYPLLSQIWPLKSKGRQLGACSNFLVIIRLDIKALLCLGILCQSTIL